MADHARNGVQGGLTEEEKRVCSRWVRSTGQRMFGHEETGRGHGIRSLPVLLEVGE